MYTEPFMTMENNEILDIGELKQDEAVSQMITLFEGDEKFETLQDFEAGNPASIWHYFRKAISLSCIGFPDKDERVVNLFRIVRKIAIEIKENSPGSLYEFILEAGGYNRQESMNSSSFVGGWPEREQFVWHMLLWFLPQGAAITTAVERRLNLLCTNNPRLPFDKAMSEMLRPKKPAAPADAIESKDGADDILTTEGRKNREKLISALKQIKKGLKNKADYLAIELALNAMNLIQRSTKHTPFIRALTSWGIITDEDKITANRLRVKLSQTGIGASIKYEDWVQKYPRIVTIREELLALMK